MGESVTVLEKLWEMVQIGWLFIACVCLVFLGRHFIVKAFNGVCQILKLKL